jgi:hypothetical protein
VVGLQIGNQSQGAGTLTYVCWLASNSPISVAGFSSQWKVNASSGGPTAAQTSALAAGYWIEVVRNYPLNSGVTTAQIEAYVQTDWTNLQAQQSAGLAPALFYGDFWDDSANWQLQ